jgi:DNA polymerase-3 subunit gamma/tau
VTTQQVKDAWPQILEAVQRAKRSAWMVVFTAQVRSLNGDVLTLSFPSDNDVQSFRQPEAGGALGTSEYLRQAIVDVLGIRVKFIARADSAPGGGGSPRPSGGAPTAPTAETWPGAEPPSTPGPAPAGAASGDASGNGSSDGGASPAVAFTSGGDAASTPSRSDAAPAAGTDRMPASRVDAPSGASRADAAAAAPPVATAAVTEWATVAIPSSPADEAVATAGSATAAVVTLERPATPPSATAPAGAPMPAPPVDEPPFDDVPPPETEPPFEPPVPEEPAGDWASAPSTDAEHRAAARSPQDGPGSAGASGRSARPSSAPAAGSRTPTFQQPQRYGEAVVREILGATFLEEQPAPPTPGMR